MRSDGKAYRIISVTYFAIHCVHLVLMIIASFLPYVDARNAFEFCEENWPFLCIGFGLLAVGCFCAWRTIKFRPYYSIPALVLTISWNLIILFNMVPVAFGFALGIGIDIMSYGMLLVCVDIAYILYMLVLLFVTPKAKLHK